MCQKLQNAGEEKEDPNQILFLNGGISTGFGSGQAGEEDRGGAADHLGGDRQHREAGSCCIHAFGVHALT